MLISHFKLTTCLHLCIMIFMNASFLERHQNFKDFFNIAIFIAIVAVGTIFVNSYVFRSFNVVGPSMESTMYTGDKLIVNKIAPTASQLGNKPYIPKRGQIIVFKNPQFQPGGENEYIVKRVIGLPGDRVLLKDGHYTVYNKENPDGFDPDKFNHNEPGKPTSGSTDVTVPTGSLFVSGDHRQENYSYDSRNGLGFVPLNDVIGPVSFRIWPLNKLRAF